MSLNPIYAILENNPVDPLIIQDVGYQCPVRSVTNGAEHVVEELVQRGLLPEGRQLFYYDSMNEFAEILVRNRKFAGFKFPISESLSSTGHG
jgi:predicted AAA+ superfamily ATPase